MNVVVDDVVLKGPSTPGGSGHMVMFVYTDDVQPATGSAGFKVAVDGGAGPDTVDGPAPKDAPAAEGESLAVSVGEARSRFRYGVFRSRWGHSSR